MNQTSISDQKMCSFWNELLATSDTMSNVNIVCSNGVIASHKIIVASASNFIKNIIISIPIGDDVTIFLPEFGKERVEEFLSLNNTLKKEKDIFAEPMEDAHLRSEPINNPNDEHNVGPYYPEDELTSDTNLIIKNNDLFETKQEVLEDPNLKESFEKPCNNPKPHVLSIRSKKNNVQINYSCEDLEKDLIQNPTTDIERRKNALTQKKIAFEKALAYYKSDESISIRAAALKFDIHPNTLRTSIKTGKSYQGKGRKQTILTKEEENIIVDRAMDIVNSGQNFDRKVLWKIIEDDVEIININFPDRNIQMSSDLVRHLAERNELDKFFPKDKKARDFQCDVCCKKFTWKKAMILHQKRLHYSFLY